MIFKNLLLSSIFSVMMLTGAYADSYVCPNNLPYGQPTLNKSVIQICHTGYFTDYSAELKIPLFVSWTLTSEHAIGCIQRDKVNSDRFQHDPLANGVDAKPSKYTKSGFDTGHLADAGDFDWNMSEFIESFYMTNMTPQVPGLNRGGWKTVEGWTRVWAHDRGGIVIYAGPIVSSIDKKLAGDIDIPQSFWKIIYDPKRNEAIAFIMPNQNVNAHDVRQYIVSVNKIEALASITIPLPTSYNKDATSNLSEWVVNTTAFLHAKQSFCAINHPNQ